MIGGYIYRDTDQLEGFTKYAVEMGLGAMINITKSLIHKTAGVRSGIGLFDQLH
jgi:hypothetical protein